MDAICSGRSSCSRSNHIEELSAAIDNYLTAPPKGLIAVGAPVKTMIGYSGSNAHRSRRRRPAPHPD